MPKPDKRIPKSKRDKYISGWRKAAKFLKQKEKKGDATPS